MNHSEQETLINSIKGYKMKIDEKYESIHTGNSTLVVKRIYNKNLGVVQVDDTDTSILFAQHSPEPPHLCLAHVSNEHTEMKLKTEEMNYGNN